MNVTRRTRVTALIGILILAGALALLARCAFFPQDAVPRDAVCVPRDAATLEEALRHIAPGGTIALDGRSGPVSGPVYVDVPDITIRSYGAAARVVGAAGSPAITLRAGGVGLRNLDVSGGSVGLLVLSSGCRVEELSLHDTPVALRISGANQVLARRIDISAATLGLEISSSGACEVRDVDLRDLTETGIRLTTSWGTTIERISVLRAPIGVLLENASRDVRLSEFAVEGCGDAGVIVRGSTHVTLARGTVRDAAVGIRLDQATGCEILDSYIRETETAAILLAQSLQNGIRGNAIRAPGETGVRLTESVGNAIADNDLRGGSVAAIALRASPGNLVESNRIREASDGIRIEDASSNLILRNSIAARNIGLVVTGSADCRILQNRVSGGAFGVGVAASTGSVLLRNRAADSSAAAFALVGASSGASVRQNDAVRSRVGFLVAASARSDLLDNRATGNQVGFLLARCGAGVRLEGNHIEANAVGLRQTDSVDDVPTDLALLAGIPEDAPASVAPILTNNLFLRNRQSDVQNRSPSLVYAAGNRWGGDTRVSTGVTLEASAWKAEVAVGASNSIVDGVLGAIVKAALSSSGAHVIDLIGMEDAQGARAIETGDVQVSVGRVRGAMAHVTALTLPARDGWAALVPAAVADRLPEATLSAFALYFEEQTQSLLWAVPETYGATPLAAFRAAYGLDEQVRAVVWAKSIEEAESLLTLQAVQFALLDSLEETKTGSGFVALVDDRGALPSAALAIAVRDDVLAAHPDIAKALSEVASRLTSAVLHDLVSQVRLLARSPEAAADEFLTREHLIGH